MKTPVTWKSEKAQHLFEAALVVVVLLILPALPLGKYGGGILMVTVSVLGLGIYFALFGSRLRASGQLMWIVVALVLGAVVSAGVTLLGPWAP